MSLCGIYIFNVVFHLFINNHYITQLNLIEYLIVKSINISEWPSVGILVNTKTDKGGNCCHNAVCS